MGRPAGAQASIFDVTLVKTQLEDGRRRKESIQLSLIAAILPRLVHPASLNFGNLISKTTATLKTLFIVTQNEPALIEFPASRTRCSPAVQPLAFFFPPL